MCYFAIQPLLVTTPQNAVPKALLSCRNTHIIAPLEGITRHTMINTCMPHAHSHTMVICETKQDWNEDRVLKALDDLQEKTSSWGSFSKAQATLKHHAWLCHSKFKVGSTLGSETVLTKEEEAEWVKWAING